MATIKNIGIKCDSREQARNLAKTLPEGRVIDMAKHNAHFVDIQITCHNLMITNNSPRWIVLHTHIVNIAHTAQKTLTRRAGRFIKQCSVVKQAGKNIVVMTRKGAMQSGAMHIRFNSEKAAA